jgi:hypothetical protein
MDNQAKEKEYDATRYKNKNYPVGIATTKSVGLYHPTQRPHIQINISSEMRV